MDKYFNLESLEGTVFHYCPDGNEFEKIQLKDTENHLQVLLEFWGQFL